jgi:hypothetical protein
MAGAHDIYGNVIDTDYIFTFSTGSIRNYAYPIGANYGLAITGAHRENTRFSIYVSGTPSVGFELYRLADERLWNIAQGGYYGDQLPAWISRENLVREWTTTFDWLRSRAVSCPPGCTGWSCALRNGACTSFRCRSRRPV